MSEQSLARSVQSPQQYRRSIRNNLIHLLQETENRTIQRLQRISLPLLRCAIGLVFVWFGALKVSNVSPVGNLVANTLPWFDPTWVIPLLGTFEMVLGFALLIGRFLTIVCAALIAHLTGTFMSVAMQPDVVFQHGNPLMLTTEGEFVVKNFVFIAAGLVIAARFRRREAHQPIG